MTEAHIRQLFDAPRLKPRLWKRARVWGGLLLSFMGAALTVAAQAPDEYEVKAAFLLNFARFVTWPPMAFNSSAAPLKICIIGDDPFGRGLDELVRGESIGGHPVILERLRRGQPTKTCQMVFLSKAEKNISAFLGGLGPGVLTVSDRDGFLDEGGMIALVVENQHVRFDINQRAALGAALTMNARMLNVARNVRK